MLGYIARRLLLIIPTLFGIMLINFVIVQAAPGGPVERMIAHIKHADTGGATERISSMGGETSGLRASSALQATPNSQYLGAQGVDPELIKRIEKMYGFDKSPAERFWLMIKSYLRFDFGKSYYRDVPVTQLIVEKMPVSISLGVWTMLLGYLVSIPLGIWKAVRDGGRFDVWSSTVIIIGYAVPSFLFAIFLIILFSGGSYWNIFPMHGLVSENWQSLSVWGKVSDYLWHMVLPITSMVVGGFASLTMLTKNSFLDEISKQYVVTARAKGLGERQVLLGHVFRNAMLIVIAGFPSAFIGVLFRSALLIEIIFSLDGMGLLGFEAIVNRDYPVVFGTLYIFTMIGLLLNLVGDLTYVLVDPRIDFERRADA